MDNRLAAARRFGAHYRLAVWVAVGAICPGISATAQGTPRLTTLAAIVDSVERAGAAWARDTVAVRVPAMYSRATAGTSQRRCVETRGVQTVRSGEFAIWGQLAFTTAKKLEGDSAMKAMFAGWSNEGGPRKQKVGWTPLHHPAHGGFTFEFWPVDQASAPPTISSSIAYTGDGEPPFISSSLAIPDPGTYVAVAKSGPDWGCFIFRKN